MEKINPTKNRLGTSLLRALIIEHRIPWRYRFFFDSLRDKDITISKKLSIARYVIHYRIYSAYLTSIKGYKQLTEKDIVKFNARFNIFIKNKLVFKIPKYETFSAYESYSKLKRRDEFKEYNYFMSSSKKLPIIGGFVGDAKRVFRDGSYISTYVEGYNLTFLKERLDDGFCLEKKDKKKILLSIKRFLSSLKRYQKVYGPFRGDWSINNMVYSIKDDQIINIDLEGFYTYKEYSRTNEIKRIQDQLKDLIKKLDKC